MASVAASLPWGAPVSFGYFAGINVAAVYLPFLIAAFALLVGVVTLGRRPRAFAPYLLQLVAATLIARYAVIPLIRVFIQTVRPYASMSFLPVIAPVYEFSFPSAHTAVLAALAFVAWRVRPAAGAALLFGAVVVGIARVLAGVHWPVDIVGGVIVGGLAAMLAIHGSRLVLHTSRS